MQRVINNIDVLAEKNASNVFCDIFYKNNWSEEAYELLSKSLFPNFELSNLTEKLLASHNVTFDSIKPFVISALDKINYSNLNALRTTILGGYYSGRAYGPSMGERQLA